MTTTSFPVVSKTVQALETTINTRDPAQPKKDSPFLITKEAAKTWTTSRGGKYKIVLQKLIKEIRPVSFDKFVHALGQCISVLPKTLNGRCVILVTPKKSNQWVAELAAKYHGFFGTYLPLGLDYAKDFTASMEKMPKKDFPTNIVLFDDASFSGKQMNGHVSNVAGSMKAKRVGGSIFVVVPYMTSVAQAKLGATRADSLTSRITINVYHYQEIRTVQEAMKPADFRKLRDVFPDRLQEVDTGVATTYFQHKAPNGLSFILHSEGVLPPITPPYEEVAKKKGTKEHKSK
jgi:hypothetical protein